MKFSYNWLKQLVDFNATSQALADELSLKSVEVEGIEEMGGTYMDTVIVGEVTSCEQHPDADRLKVCRVDTGGAMHQIVCGSPNVRAGIKVPVALPGTKLPNGEIKVSKLRGIESQGMICGADEIGLGGETHDIMTLPEGTQVGMKLSTLYHDYVLDGAILPNRGDLQSHTGLAREIAAIYNKEYTEAVVGEIQEEGSTHDYVDIEWRHDFMACPLYQACIVTNIQVQSSPAWMQARLMACGIRPINNIVDITNLVMLEMGNPLHAFDYSKVGGEGRKTIAISLSKKGENITTLDGVSRELPDGILVISDLKHPIAIAGVIGGKDTGVSDSTTQILLEAAHFTSPIIRHSQRTLGITTESSVRFAKGLPIGLATAAMERARSLISQICPEAEIATVEIKGDQDQNPVSLRVNPQQILDFLAQDITLTRMEQILLSLGFIVINDGTTWLIQVPIWRNDVTIWQDIAEEVGRIYGFDTVPEVLPETTTIQDKPKIMLAEQAVRRHFVSAGYSEIFTYSLLKPELISLFPDYQASFNITNPLPEGNSIPRPSLIPGLVHTVALNLKKEKVLALFDVSKVYMKSMDPSQVDTEPRRLALAYTSGTDTEWGEIKHSLDLWTRDAGIILQYEATDTIASGHPGRSARILYNSQEVGQTYEVHPSILSALDIKQRVWVAEIDLSYLALFLQNSTPEFVDNESNVVYKEFSRYEISRRDLAILVLEDRDSNQIALSISSVSDIVTSVELFDDYRGEGIEKGKKSLGFRITLQAQDHTLTDAEIKEALDSIIKKLTIDFSAEIR
ncbi:MAG: phenylalanine--tRNA ligase subunit beta [Patescibacteria group bacterium]